MKSKTKKILSLAGITLSSLSAFSAEAQPHFPKRFQYFESTTPIELRGGRSAVLVAGGVRCTLRESSFPIDYTELRAMDALEKGVNRLDRMPDLGAGMIPIAAAEGVVGVAVGIPTAIAELIHSSSNTWTHENLVIDAGFRFLLQNWQQYDEYDNAYELEIASWGSIGYANANGRHYTVDMNCTRISRKDQKEYIHASQSYYPTYVDGTSDVADFLNATDLFTQKFPPSKPFNWNNSAHNSQRLHVKSLPR